MKKYLVRFVHKLVIVLHLDELIISLARVHPFFKKFIPLETSYCNPSFRTVKRNEAIFKLNIHDYMQWHIWADIKYWSCKLASKYQNGVILDVGANVGAFTLKTLANTINCTVHSFEPNPLILKNLIDNSIRNQDLKERLVINSFAVANFIGSANLFIDNLNSGASGLSTTNEKENFVEVKTITLDHYVQQNNIENLKFIKIDVEGFELEVIEGAIHTIIKFKPDLYIEVTPKWWSNNGYPVTSVLENLKRLGYKFFPLIDENQSRLKEEGIESIVNMKEQFNLYLTCKE